MNLYCMGSGNPTVAFESGLSDWSSNWALIQPAVAASTRACSYDRPGMGYSDSAPDPRTPEVAVEDLRRLLDGAGIDAPIVLVGHSLGGFYPKLFAVTYPDRIAGLAPVDPSEERLWERVDSRLASRSGTALVRTARKEGDDGIAASMAHFKACAADAHAGALTEERYRKCSDPIRAPLGSVILAERRVLQAMPTYQDAQAAELADSIYGNHPEADARYARRFADVAPLRNVPLLVLTHGLWDMSEATSEIDYQALASGAPTDCSTVETWQPRIDAERPEQLPDRQSSRRREHRRTRAKEAAGFAMIDAAHDSLTQPSLGRFR
jgi:pimeloyl-ACP methyl ester carboxylesterase